MLSRLLSFWYKWILTDTIRKPKTTCTLWTGLQFGWIFCLRILRDILPHYGMISLWGTVWNKWNAVVWQWRIQGRGSRDAPRSNFFQFKTVFCEQLGCASPSGKYWIHHWPLLSKPISRLFVMLINQMTSRLLDDGTMYQVAISLNPFVFQCSHPFRQVH